MSTSRHHRLARARSLKWRLALVALLPWWIGACASESHVRSLAASGIAYGTALDSLLRFTEETAIDASSARVLSETRDEKDANLRKGFLDQQDSTVKPLLAEFEKLRQHARLLGRYFQALSDLAADSSDKTVSDSIVASAQAVQKVGEELGASKFLGPPEQEVLRQVAAIAVRAVRDRAIASELDARTGVIDRQLRVQSELLKALRRQVKSDLGSVYTLGYARDVKTPFAKDQIGDTKSWMDQRKAYLLLDRSIDALEKASDAASKLRSAWRAYAEGRLDEAASKDILKEVDAALSLAESVKAVGR